MDDLELEGRDSDLVRMFTELRVIELQRRGWEMEVSRLPESPDSIFYHFDA